MTEHKAIYVEDELKVPSWLNTEFFENVFNHYEQTVGTQLKSLQFEPATPKGDHFGSVAFRALIVYIAKRKDKSIKLIIKTFPNNDKAKEPEETRLFETEIGMYTKVLPTFEKILRERGDNTQLGVNLKPHKVVMLEDIVPLGYKVLRSRRPNLEETKATFSKIAKWHAVSYKINSENPHFFDEFRYGFFNEFNCGRIAPHYEGFSTFELLETVEELKQYRIQFEPFIGKLVHKVVEGFSEARNNPQAEGFYVLSHGDLHFKNLMFKYEQKSETLSDVMLLDFQMSYLGPMVYDILNAIYMMFDANLRANYKDELYYFYFSTFQKTLSKIGFKDDIPKMLDFKKQLIRHKNYELYLLTFCLPLWQAMSDDKIDPEMLFRDKEGRKIAWQSARYIEEVKQLLPKFLHMGYLESL